MRYLVTGGAGFMGSHIVLALHDQGHDVTVLDNLSTGHKAAIPQGVCFRHVNLMNYQETYNCVAEHPWNGIFHCAALSIVSDSMRQPIHYIHYNTQIALNLIQACIHQHVKKIIFSSTAALFGGSDYSSNIPDDAPINPNSPYGESKFMVERILHWANHAHNIRSACLRYFNAAGSDPDGRAGEDHRPETHLIPLAIDAALGRRPSLKIFGTDYPTPDGSCIRDYIHVTDLADAHIKLLDHIDKSSLTYNIGNGKGYSNIDIIRSVERVTGCRVPWVKAERRPGDAPVLVADSSALHKKIDWRPHFVEIDDIINTVFRWRLIHPNGYDF